VILGVTTTFLGICPLAFSNSEVFRVFFEMFLGIVLFGGAHGLIVFPVLLSLIGPTVRRRPSRADDAQQDLSQLPVPNIVDPPPDPPRENGKGIAFADSSVPAAVAVVSPEQGLEADAANGQVSDVVRVGGINFGQVGRVGDGRTGVVSAGQGKKSGRLLGCPSCWLGHDRHATPTLLPGASDAEVTLVESLGAGWQNG